jgi:DNA-3-methyladenine glycosylase I
MNEYCRFAPSHPIHGPYHDLEYGFPQRDDNVLFERLTLEIFQAGLSWEIVLKKRAALQEIYSGFDLVVVSRYGSIDRERILADPRGIRNRLKVDAVIENSRRILSLSKSHGSFADWLDSHHPREKADWVKLFKQTFLFTGGEITGEFLMSLGYLPGAHSEDCPVWEKIQAARG